MKKYREDSTESRPSLGRRARMASTVLCVRVSSHKMALYSGSPVTLSHTIVVSLWRNKERALNLS